MTDADILQKLDQYEAEASSEKRPKRPGRGSHKSFRRMARERLAVELGFAVETIRKKDRASAEREAVADDGVDPVESLGMELSTEFKALCAKAQWYIDAADNDLRKAKGKLTEMANALGEKFPGGMLQRIRASVDEAASAVRGGRPSSLCPWCKGLDEVQEHCGACHGSGFITKNQEAAVPDELKRVDKPVVMIDGRARFVDDFTPEINAIPDLPPGENDWGLPS